jgi:sulfite exporter TauE/SafE
MELILTAISLGFLGSFHCIGMCGPIALALPVGQKSLPGRVLAILAYNSGRILTYSVFGLFFGLIGQSIHFFGYQQKLSILLGVLILAALFLSKQQGLLRLNSRLYAILQALKNKLAGQFRKQGISSLFSIGVLNGLLPCGLVYLAAAGATASGSVAKSTLFMALFGAGTLPLMFSLSFTSHLFSLKARNMIRKGMPLVIGLMAVLLILRGLNLGISYISPKISEEKSVATSSCHTPIKCCPKK